MLRLICKECLEMEDHNDKWLKLMRLGVRLHCHQMPERSFFWKGYQFPVCARCFGVIIGHILGIVSLFFIEFSIVLSIAFLLLMFFDWFLQYLGILESTNVRRLITGILGGFGIIVLPVQIVRMLW